MFKFLKLMWLISLISFMYHILLPWDLAWLKAEQLVVLGIVTLALALALGVLTSEGYGDD